MCEACNKLAELGIVIDAYKSDIDGQVVVHIDTPGLVENSNGPILRVYLNDNTEEPLWNNTEESVKCS